MNGFLQLAGTTLVDTPAAWRRLAARLPGARERWFLLIVTIILSSLAAWMLSRLLGPYPAPPANDPTAQMMALLRQLLEARPLIFTALQALWVVFAIGAVTYIGRLFGGRARFDEVVLAAGWMKALLLVLQVLQLVLVNLSMAAAAMVSMAESVLYLFLAVRLTQIVHGFPSPFRVALVMVAAFFLILFALALRLALFGLAPVGVATHGL